MDIEAKVKTFIVEEFAVGIAADELDADLDLVESEILDSLGLLTVVAWIEDLLEVEIDVGMLDTADFRSVGSICRLIEQPPAAESAGLDGGVAVEA